MDASPIARPADILSDNTSPPHMRISVLRLVAGLTVVAASAQAQRAGTTPFTADDALDVVNYSVADLSRDGRWIAATSTTRRASLGVDYRRDGDPTYIRPAAISLWSIDTESGKATPVFSQPQNLRSPQWSPDATRLAVLVLRNGKFEPVIWERAAGRTRTLAVPTGHYVAENSSIDWTHDGSRIVLALRSEGWKKRATEEFERLTSGPVFVQDSKEPFLAWDAMRRMGNVRSIHAIDVSNGRATELIPEMLMAQYAVSKDDSVVTWQQDITKKTDYDVIFGTENKLMARTLQGGEPVTVQPTLKGLSLSWAEDGRRYAYSREGRVYVARIGDSTRRQIAGPDSGRADADTSAVARASRANQRFSAVRWAPSGDALLLRNRQGLWIADVASAAREMILAQNDSQPAAPRYNPIGWSQDGRYVYFTYSSRTEWERGLVRYDRTSRSLQDLVKDDRLYQGVRLSENGNVFVYSSAEGNRPPDIYVAGADMRNPRRLTNANEAFDGRSFAQTRLLSYLDVDGKTRYGVVYLPANYEEGKKYPTLFNVYEEFFDNTFDATANVLASNGYVVVKPSVGFEIGFPGEAWLKGVTSAANALIQQGIADSSKLGVFGTSYGGYAVNLLVTQTDRFKAAVNVSGKVDVISFYTDSPRLGVRNTHAAEKSQDRLGATLWEQPQKYIAHSAIMFADRIKTPLLLITGEQDSNVPAGNTREMYYALRRLGKDVVWVNYMNSGHGTPGTNEGEFVDYHKRILEFFGKHLRGEQERVNEATSLNGQPLHRVVPTGQARATMERELADAKRAYERTPANADSIIWYGRRVAYLGRFNDAIRIFGEGIEKNPNDARLYRHRGHRYLSTRQLDLAIKDFERAAELTRGKPDEVEPDGRPNERNTPIGTLQSNIWYHLGLSYYVKGDFNSAARAYREGMKVASTPDKLVSMSNWYYLTLRRLGQTAAAAKLLEPISRDMEVIENASHHKLLLMYKGELKPENLLVSMDGAVSSSDMTAAYGVAAWHLVNGRKADAEGVYSRILASPAQWSAFGFLAAEADITR